MNKFSFSDAELRSRLILGMVAIGMIVVIGFSAADADAADVSMSQAHRAVSDSVRISFPV
jgi:hypothetical protein